MARDPGSMAGPATPVPRRTATPAVLAREATKGLSRAPVDALRYDGQSDDPHEAAGLIISLIPRGARVLDIGCGTGSVTRLIRDRCQAEVRGVEPNAARVTRARERGLSVIQAPFPGDLGADLGTFDVVVFADVLEHLVDPVAALEAAKTFLRPTGQVVASIPNVAHWTVRWDLLKGRFDYRPCGIMDATHLRWFTRAGVCRLFTAAGYRIERHCLSVGNTLPEYHERFPWKWIPGRPRSSMLYCLVKAFPLLFGCQHIVAARIGA